MKVKKRKRGTDHFCFLASRVSYLGPARPCTIRFDRHAREVLVRCWGAPSPPPCPRICCCLHSPYHSASARSATACFVHHARPRNLSLIRRPGSRRASATPDTHASRVSEHTRNFRKSKRSISVPCAPRARHPPHTPGVGAIGRRHRTRRTDAHPRAARRLALPPVTASQRSGRVWHGWHAARPPQKRPRSAAVSGAGGAYGSISSAARAASPASWIGGWPLGAGACSAGASCSTRARRRTSQPR